MSQTEKPLSAVSTATAIAPPNAPTIGAGTPTTRRSVVLGFGALAASTALGAALLPGLTSRYPQAVAQRVTDATKFEMSDLLQVGDLADMVKGNDDAKVTIIEYASMTCGHCGNFHRTVYPDLKEKYIDTGMVRMIFREFPLDNYAAAASMLARCVAKDAPDTYFPFIDVLFQQQDTWAYVPATERVDTLFNYAKQAGMTREAFEGCLRDQALLDNLKWIQDRGRDQFGVSSTPTFFVNGIKLQGGNSLEAIEEVMAPFLES